MDHFRSAVLDCCKQYVTKPIRTRGPLSRQHITELKDLKNNSNIVIWRPDKGSGIVLMNKEDYIKKLEDILQDKTKFHKCTKEKDKTTSVENALSKVLHKMHKDLLIDSETLEKLKPSGCTIPRLYGLPKVHKQGIPLRPVLDMYSSPYHAIAKWTSKLLEPVRKVLTRYSLWDTFEFVDRIKYVNHSDKRLLSFDVVPLFTNVTLTETVSYICDFINEHKLNIGIPTHYLKEIILRCTLNIQFCFNNKLYRQIDGVAMGSPLGPVLADCYMAKLENTVLSGAIKQLTFYSRFVDDTFIMCDNDVDIDKVLELFNTAHPSVSFTMSEEQNGEIPFLDVLLIGKDDGYLERRMYRKMDNPRSIYKFSKLGTASPKAQPY